MALLNYTSPGVIAPDFAAKNALALRGPAAASANTAPARTAWWYDSSGQKRSMPLTGELANATSVTSRNGSLVVNGPFGEKVFGGGGAVNTTTASGTEAPPKFDVLRNVKDPEIDAAATSALRGAQSTGAQTQNLFQNYLDQFNAKSGEQAARLDRETATYDTAAADLDKSLQKNLETQKANLERSKQVDLNTLLGNDERYSLTRGPLGTGRSGEQERTFADSYYRASLPYQERLGLLDRQNIGDVYASRLNTAPLARRATNEALSALLTPAQAASSIRSDELRNLGAAANLVSSNRFYTPYSSDPRLIPDLPTPNAGYRLPSIPNYGGVGSPTRSPGYAFPGGLPSANAPQATTRSSAEEAYFRQTGRYPQNDPYFNEDVYTSLGGRVQQPQNGFAVAPTNVAYAAGQDSAQRLQTARAYADSMYQQQTGMDPNMDRNYNEEVWRAFYNEALNGQ
jgi:hypothetical protein